MSKNVYEFEVCEHYSCTIPVIANDEAAADKLFKEWSDSPEGKRKIQDMLDDSYNGRELTVNGCVSSVEDYDLDDLFYLEAKDPPEPLYDLVINLGSFENNSSVSGVPCDSLIQIGIPLDGVLRILSQFSAPNYILYPKDPPEVFIYHLRERHKQFIRPDFDSVKVLYFKAVKRNAKEVISYELDCNRTRVARSEN